MATKFFARMADGERKHLPARKFSHVIGDRQYWFALHKQTDNVGLSVSHWDSGKGVRDVGPTTVMACLHDEKMAARLVLDQLVARVGAAKVISVLDAA